MSQFCEYEGGILVNIDDEHDQKLIEFFLESADPTGEHHFWIGLNDLFHEGTFLWEPNRTEPTYTNWDVGQPNNLGGIEHFGMVWGNLTDRGFRKWNDAPNQQSNETFALCEIDI